jgi:hypothetical protein
MKLIQKVSLIASKLGFNVIYGNKYYKTIQVVVGFHLPDISPPFSFSITIDVMIFWLLIFSVGWYGHYFEIVQDCTILYSL